MKSDEELTRRYRQQVYVGRSKRSGRAAPSLEKALANAYEQAPKPKKEKKSEEVTYYRVIDIWAGGTNPLSEYIVVVAADT